MASGPAADGGGAVDIAPQPTGSGKKAAAAPGSLESVPTGAGDAAAAAPAGGEVTPDTSTLIGDGTEGLPAAAARNRDEGGRDAGGDDSPPEPSSPETSSPQPWLADSPPEAARQSGPAPLPAPTQQVTIRKTGFWPVAFGGVVAAGIGAAATIWALPHLPEGWLPDTPGAVEAPQVDIAAIRADAVGAAQHAARAEVEALRAELAAATPAPAAPSEPAASAAELATLVSRLDEQAARIEELSARPALDPEVAQRVQTLADQASALEQQIQSAAQEAQSDISAAQAEAQKLQDAAADSTRRAEAVAAIASLQAALDRGVTPEEARQTLAGAGLDAPDALTREVPSLESLQAGFGEAARAGLRAALREDSAAGGNLLTNFLRAQTGARSVNPREGDDPDAILSRAGARVDAGEIAAALDEMAALPEPARTAPAMATWLAGAAAYRDAQSALSDLSANSN